jgi:glyoxylase-like metal-dependent hydrolase (beta-lactamase superfamily II)
MRRSRKPFRAVRSDEGSNPSPSAQRSGASRKDAPLQGCGGLRACTGQSAGVRARPYESTTSRPRWRTTGAGRVDRVWTYTIRSGAIAGRTNQVTVFSLEVLQAEQGDCLLIHFGLADAPQSVLVNGGPAGVTYPDVLEPRLRRLAQRRRGPVELPLVVCSHIDDDHIGGVLDLVRAVAAKETSTTIGSVWHNRPLQIVREQEPARLAAVLRERDEVEGSPLRRRRRCRADPEDRAGRAGRRHEVRTRGQERQAR